jgi:geranylgeranyl diphosphate synthase, type II
MNADYENVTEALAGSRPATTDIHGVKRAVDARLADLAEAAADVPHPVRNAVRYALLAPGKRVRPLLIYLIIDPRHGESDTALDLGCAIEMVHTASLILDDLPCMDDALLRRQRPATHVVFGQSTAILAAVALLTRAFAIIANLEPIGAEARTRLSAVLADAVGWDGLVSGQELDVSHSGSVRDPQQIERLNWLKTGVLFAATVEMGAIVRDYGAQQTLALKSFARHLGLAFQAYDDILDSTASCADIGKDVGKDARKVTLISLMGPAHAHAIWRQHLRRAEQALAESGLPPTLIVMLVRQLFEQERRP